MEKYTDSVEEDHGTDLEDFGMGHLDDKNILNLWQCNVDCNNSNNRNNNIVLE
jgi:hypothetical protein